jgi:ABC-2 type transport system permease protein
MKRLLEIEFLKLRGYRAFWVLIIVYFAALMLTLIGIEPALDSIASNANGAAKAFLTFDINSFPDVWRYNTYTASIFTYILVIVVVFLVSSEFTYKTMRQNVINGLSRMEFLTGKILMISTLALACTGVVFLVSMVQGFISGGFDFGDIVEKIGFLLGYFLQTIGYLMLSFWVTLLVKRSGIAIGLLFIYFWFIENVINIWVPDEIDRFFPLKSMNLLTKNPFATLLDGLEPPPFDPLQATVAALYVVLFAGLSALYLRNKDI